MQMHMHAKVEEVRQPLKVLPECWPLHSGSCMHVQLRRTLFHGLHLLQVLLVKLELQPTKPHARRAAVSVVACCLLKRTELARTCMMYTYGTDHLVLHSLATIRVGSVPVLQHRLCAILKRTLFRAHATRTPLLLLCVVRQPRRSDDAQQHRSGSGNSAYHRPSGSGGGGRKSHWKRVL